VEYGNGEPLLWIDARIISGIDFSTDEWIIGMESQIADGNALPIQEVVISIPKIVLNKEGFSMSQNFPNPFRTNCDISYYLPESAKVLLKVYNILGMEMKTLVDQAQPAGSHTIHFEDRDFPEGIYLYKIEVAGNGTYYTKTKEMVVGR
jgi:hypothetical protein